jgi:outer membrane protein assembly factor BamA
MSRPFGFLLLLALLASPQLRAEEPAGSPSSLTTQAPLASEEVLPAVVDAVEVEGLWRTKRLVVLRELPWREGETVTPEAWTLGLERLWNLPIFSRVAGTLQRRDGRLIAVIRVEERWTVNLILRFGVGGGTTWWALGVSEFNTLGRLVEAAGSFQRFGKITGGEAWIRDPRFLDRREELSFTAGLLGRPRPEFTLLRTSGRLEFLHQIHDAHIVGARLEVMHDRLRPNDDPEGERQGKRGGPEMTMAGLGGVWRLGRVNTQRLLFEGWSFELRPTLLVSNDGEHDAYGQVQGQLLWFKRWGTRLNLGVRLLGAATTDAPAQQQFFIGGLEQVRSLPDNALTTTAFALANVEARLLAFDSTWFAVMGVLFVDAIGAHPSSGTATGLVAPGFGIRLMVPRFVQSGLRIDYAAALPGLHVDWRRPNIGVWQFF